MRQRKMVQWALAYLAAAWVVLQVVGLAAESYDWPHMVMRLSFGIVALGFVVTVVVAWYHGDRGEQKISGVELLILTVLLAVGGGVLWRTERSGALPMPSASQAVPKGATLSTPASTAVAPATSIAVLPFVDMSQAKDQEYFSDGLSEELLNLLAQLPQLRVIARTSSFSFKGKEADVATIAKALNVANVLEGSVRKSGNTLRI
ncbi:MAG TPA: hypothetical protein VNM48_01215, partial [Chloroflexota bacterium]|nr:hypothetical protein [Chloroflexota bacterium]